MGYDVKQHTFGHVATTEEFADLCARQQWETKNAHVVCLVRKPCGRVNWQVADINSRSTTWKLVRKI